MDSAGRSRPPLALDRKSPPVSADLAKATPPLQVLCGKGLKLRLKPCEEEDRYREIPRELFLPCDKGCINFLQKGLHFLQQAFSGLCVGGANRHGSTKKPEGGVTDVGDGFLLIQCQLWVVWLATGCMDG